MKTTKNYLSYLCLALMLAFSLGLSSCSDDDENVGSKEDLIGTWQCILYEVTDIEDGEKDSYTDDMTWIITFNEDGTCIENGYNYNSTWSYKGNKLIIWNEEGINYYEDETFTVKTLTSSKLVLETHYKEKEDGIVYESHERFTFKKISD